MPDYTPYIQGKSLDNIDIYFSKKLLDSTFLDSSNSKL